MRNRTKELVLLTWRMSGFAMVGLIWFLVLDIFLTKMLPRLAYFTAGKPVGNDAPCGRPECDFSQFWPAGLLARAHHYSAIYDPMAFWTARRAIVLATAGRIDWIYPPPMLMPAMLISYLPFEWGFLAWTLALTVAAVGILRWAGVSWPVVVIGLVSPAALWNFELGQVGSCMGALLLAGLLMGNRAPLRAGFLAGLLVLKPQVGLLLPAVFLARRWFAGILGAIFAVAVVMLLTEVLMHWHVWAVYFAMGAQAAGAVLRAPFALGYQQFGVSVFWMMRSFGAGVGASFAVQGVSSAASIAGAWWLWRAPRLALPSLVALTVCLSLLATPYGFTYDMVAYSLALTMLAEARGWRIDPLDALAWLWPALCPVVVMRTGLLLTPLVVTMASWRIWWRASLAPRGSCPIAP